MWLSIFYTQWPATALRDFRQANQVQPWDLRCSTTSAKNPWELWVRGGSGSSAGFLNRWQELCDINVPSSAGSVDIPIRNNVIATVVVLTRLVYYFKGLGM